MLPALSTYSTEQLEKASVVSPAIGRYLQQIQLSPSTPSGELRLRRHRRWLEAALATVLETARAPEVCRAWSESADELLSSAWRLSGMHESAACLLALGKLGARELNLSSDVDLILVAEPEDLMSLEPRLKVFRQILAGVTELGYALRLDFDLRPGGRFGPLFTTPKQMTDYYWHQGETWERLAWIRMRPVVGSPELIESCNEIGAKYCYRKFLDYTLLDDLKKLRSRIHRSFEGRSDAINLKLSVGGIRDIELFVHAQLVIQGGRHPHLRTTSTDLALVRLKDAGLLQIEEADTLLRTYWRFRTIENQIQAYEDRQTHSLDPSQPYPVANRLLFSEVRSLQSTTDEIVSSLLGKVDLGSPQLPDDGAAQSRWLADLGFSTRLIEETWPALMNASALSRRSEADELARREFLFRFVQELKAHGLDYDLGLTLLADFVRATRAKASFYTLLLREPRLIRDLARLFSISPYLGQIVASRPELLDSFVLRAQNALSLEWDQLLDELAERRLLGELVSASEFLEHNDVLPLGQKLSTTADEICLTLMNRLSLELNTRPIEILALGKWGGRELGFRSDLDLIFLTTQSPTEDDHRLARRFISRLTDVHRGGRIYAIDLRLRPTGAAGPLLITHEALQNYLAQRAAAWERQSYLRGRMVGPTAWAARAEVVARGLSEDDRKELIKIHSKLFGPPRVDVIDLKFNAGGLAAIEFATQLTMLANKCCPPGTSTLAMIDHLIETEPLWKGHGSEVRSTYLRLRTIEQLFQLTSSHSGSSMSISTSEFSRLASLLRTSVPDLTDEIQTLLSHSTTRLKALDPLAGQS